MLHSVLSYIAGPDCFNDVLIGFENFSRGGEQKRKELVHIFHIHSCSEKILKGGQLIQNITLVVYYYV